jgi:dTDP-4-amino-4,6-dideoxygalactose transaminase
MQTVDSKTQPSNWMFGVRIPGSTYKDAELYFKNNGIEIRQMFFPISSHQYMTNNYVINYEDCSKAEQLNKECFILPSFPELTQEETSHIIQVTNNYLKENK